MNSLVASPVLPLLPTSHPVFDLVETATHYLLSIDLPTAPLRQPEIEVRDHEVRVISQADRDRLAPLFRYRTLDRRARAVYYQGALWLSLPKQAAPDLADLTVAAAAG